MDDLVGQKLDKYVLQSKLGEGGMGAVYRSEHPQLKRDVAIKILPPSISHGGAFQARFQREGQAMAALNHPNIIRVYDVDEDQGHYYMVMDYVVGGSLEQRLKSGTPMGLYWACDVIARVAEALNYAHRKGVIHRDIKPANILLTSEDDPVVADFGIARLVHAAEEGAEHLTQAGTVMGTPAYMAPEQILGGEVDGRSDLYSLGIVLYQLLTGRLPFTGDTMAVVTQQINAAPPPLRLSTPDLPAPLEQVVLMALAKRPQDRFGSGAAFAAAIRNALQSVGPSGFVRAAPAAVAAAASVATVHQDQVASLPQQPATTVQSQQSQTLVKLAIGAAVAAVLLYIVLQLIAQLFVPLLIVALAIGAFYIYRGYQAAQAAKQGQLGVQPGPALPQQQWVSAVQEGLALYRNGQFPEALAAFSQVLADDPKNIDALISRGLAYYTLGDLPQAEADFHAALAINPRHPRALYQRALVHQALGRLAEAQTDLEQVLMVIPAQAQMRREAEARLRSINPDAIIPAAQESATREIAPRPTREMSASSTRRLAETDLPDEVASVSSEPAQGSADQTLVYPSGAPQGSADQTLVYPSGAPQAGADQTLVYPSGAPQGSADQTLIYPSGAPQDSADQTLIYPSGAPQGTDPDQTIIGMQPPAGTQPQSEAASDAQSPSARRAPKTGPLRDE